MRKLLLPAAIAAAFAAPAVAQSNAPEGASAPGASIPVQYVSTDTRISAGIDDDGNVLGEVLKIFGHDADSAWLLEGWLGYAGAGGAKLDYHWLVGGEGGAKRTVAKVFAAIDQNEFDDRKATLGVGFEREQFFVDAYVSGALTDERLVDTDVGVDVTTISGTFEGRPFTQTQTITTTTRAFEHPYDWGVGARAGRSFRDGLARVRAGLDYEDGDFDSDQVTFSLGLDKQFHNSGHGLTLELEHYRRDGDFVRDESDTRAWLLWRYEIGRSFRPTEVAREVERVREVAVDEVPQPVVMRNEAPMDEEMFFAFDSAVLKEDEKAALDELLAEIRADKRVSRVSIVGHTCDIGTEAYNQKLSERRAAAVRDYFIAQGIDPAELEASGAGEANPKYPNDGEDNRRRNRRVDVTFLTVETTSEPAPPPQSRTEKTIEWVREPVDAPPAWIERALRNPSEHKRTVDAYRFETVASETTFGPREFINRPPVANPDAATTPRDVAVLVSVLANDTDADGDALAITSTGAAANGTVAIVGNEVRYTPNTGFTGTDTFAYTISDGNGGSASSTVTVTVTTPVPPPPPANLAPDAVDDFRFMLANTYALIDVLANDSDPDGDPLTIISVTPGTFGSTQLMNGQVILYLPNWYAWGTDTFTYTISDGRGGVDTATVTVRVFDD